MTKTIGALAAVLATMMLLTVPVAAHDAGVELPPTQDCEDREAVVVASDAQAQSDLYSAVTLAGVIDGCVVLAGDREGQFPADQLDLLDESAGAAYIVGGEAAVPTWKSRVAGRPERIGGKDRWETARMVGTEAAGIAQAQADEAVDEAVTADSFTLNWMAGTGADEGTHTARLTLTAGEWAIRVHFGGHAITEVDGNGDPVLDDADSPVATPAMTLAWACDGGRTGVDVEEAGGATTSVARGNFRFGLAIGAGTSPDCASGHVTLTATGQPGAYVWGSARRA